MNAGVKNIGLQLDAQLHGFLKVYCAQKGITIRQLLINYLLYLQKKEGKGKVETTIQQDFPDNDV